MDLNPSTSLWAGSSLTQTLSDGTYTYLYGNGRIAQIGTQATEYFLGDALGSVRQLTDAAGAITYARNYDPYGVVAQTAGASQTTYGYTGEYQDSAGMVYLRARHYAPEMGRFLARDTWAGNVNSPISFNLWLYSHGNPINLTDPGGNKPITPPLPCMEGGPRYCWLNTGGYIDNSHFAGGKRMASDLMTKYLPGVFGKPFAQISLDQPWIPKISAIGTPAIPYSTTYITNLPSSGISDKLVGVAFGIFVDFQIQYEKAQGIDPRCIIKELFYLKIIGHCSSFSNEDLPSDYLGFVSHVKKMPYKQIVEALDPSGGKAHDEAPAGYWGNVYDPLLCAMGLCGDDIPNNNCFSLKVLDELTGKYVHRAWPPSLQISPPIGFGTYWGHSASDFILSAPRIPTPPTPNSTPIPNGG